MKFSHASGWNSYYHRAGDCSSGRFDFFESGRPYANVSSYLFSGLLSESDQWGPQAVRRTSGKEKKVSGIGNFAVGHRPYGSGCNQRDQHLVEVMK